MGSDSADDEAYNLLFPLSKKVFPRRPSIEADARRLRNAFTSLEGAWNGVGADYVFKSGRQRQSLRQVLTFSSPSMHARQD